MNKSIILGNGLSALIWAAYHPNSILIGPGRPGGMAKDMKAPFFLHKHPATERLLKELGLSTCTREVKVGYGYTSTNGTYIGPYSHSDFRESYYRHSRCLDKKGLDSIPDSVMNQGVKKFEAYEINPDTLINRLIEAIMSIGGVFYKDTIREIIPDKHTIGIYGNRINAIYREGLISTIPMNIFQPLFPKEKRLDLLPEFMLTKIFLEGNKQSREVLDYDFVYLCPHPNTPIKDQLTSYITRMNNNRITKKTFFEYTFMAGDPFITKARERLIEQHGENKVSWYPGISMRKDVRLKVYHRIKLLGRGAQWDHSIKVQDVIMEAQKNAIQ